MTERLYYDDPYQIEFEARILERRPLPQGVGLVLDQTFCYPTSGGQPFDLGAVNGIPLLDVIEEEDVILHILKQDIPSDVVHVEINWQRRVDHMQQHTGQHILSAALLQLGIPTVSFHLGDEASTIDVERESLTTEEIARAERLANAVVLEDRPITSRFYEPEELAALPLRTLPKKTEHIRIVSIHDFDYSPCGGTHFRATGEVGPIKVRKWSRIGAQTRIEFLCGWRALEDYAWKHQALTELANLFSVKDRELVATVTRLAEEAKPSIASWRRSATRRWITKRSELRANAEEQDGIKYVSQLFPERDQEEVRRLALRLMDKRQDGGAVCDGRGQGAPALCQFSGCSR